MNRITENEVGIDISKASVTIGLDGKKPVTVENKKASLAEVARSLPPGSVVHMEATGGYERLAKEVFRSFGHEVRVHNPCRARRLAQALGVKAKTDMVDAKFLQNEAHKLISVKVKPPEQEKLLDVSRSIQRLTSSMADHKKYLGNDWVPDEVRHSYAVVVKAYEDAIGELEKKFKALIAKSELYERYKLVLTVANVGEKLARVVVSELPIALDGLTSSQIASYAGIAPIDNSSGKKDGARRIKRGNNHLKAALYMPSLSALSSAPWAKELYAKLIAKGRLHEQAMVAIMRKLLVRIVAVIQRGFPWQENPPQRT